MQYVKKYWWVALAGLFVVPYFAFQNMRERKEREAREREAGAEVVKAVDARVPDLSLVLRGHDTLVRYQGGKEVPTDGVGIAVLTWDDLQANPDRLKKAGYKAERADFPVVVFFNQSGFDSTGDPAVVRRARDGSVAFEVKDKPPGRLRQIVSLPDGTWTAYFWGSDEAVRVGQADFYRLYLGIEPPQPQPAQHSQAELDRMGPEELKRLGIKKVSRDEALKRAKTGVRGRVIKVGGQKTAVEPLAGVKVHALRGRVEPAANLDGKDGLVAAVDKTDKDGKFALPLPPGVYTLVVEQAGKFYGNSFRGERWPAVTVKDDWADYEFRRGN